MRVPGLALTAILVVGCGTVSPSAGPSGATPSSPSSSATPTGAPPASGPPAAEVYERIRAQVEAIRGLQPTRAVEPVSLDADQLRANLTAEFDSDNKPEALAIAEDELITLGLLPQGADLRQILLDFQAGQVAGYYSPEKDELYVVSKSGGVGATEMVTYAHEFTHQLQDQNVDLGSLGLDVPDQSDLQLARLALIEGDATSVQSTWMTSNLTPQQLGELLGSALDPVALEALQKAPPFVRETTIFRYQGGLGLVTALTSNGGYAAVDAAFRAPPDSTEQVLHPEKFMAREKPSTVEVADGVAAKLGAGWTAAAQDTLGELILSIWLKGGGIPAPEADAAAAGWGGDRLVLLRGPDGAVGVGLVTTWDTAADAAAFSAAAATAARAIDPGAEVVSDGIRKVVVAMGDRAADILVALAG